MIEGFIDFSSWMTEMWAGIANLSILITALQLVGIPLANRQELAYLHVEFKEQRLSVEPKGNQWTLHPIHSYKKTRTPDCDWPRELWPAG